MKYEIVPEISIGILADEIKLQYGVENVDELITELSYNGDSFKFYFDEPIQDHWKRMLDTTGDPYYSQLLMAASIFEDLCPDWDYVILTRR